MKARDALMKWIYEDAEGKHQCDGSSAAIYSKCCGECKPPLGVDANLPSIADSIFIFLVIVVEIISFHSKQRFSSRYKSVISISAKDIEETSHSQYGKDGQLMTVMSDVCRQTDLAQTMGQGIRANTGSSFAVGYICYLLLVVKAATTNGY